jgi:hypothetical protein
MSLAEFVSLLMVPITVLATATGVVIGVGLGTKKNRLETIRVLKARTFGAQRLSALAQLWSFYFHTLFGSRILSKRQLLTIPVFTLVVSAGFFATWIVYVYIFQNETGTLFVDLPLTMRQAAYDFYTKGIVATLVIVACTVQLTKVSILVGKRYGYGTLRFHVAFFLTIAIAYFLFSVAIFFFRLEDMVRLYADLAPNDPLPIMPYAPLSDMASSLSLFHPPTNIHVTSQGWFATYFMPEPLIFYCAATAHVSLFGIAISYQIAVGLEKLRLTCIEFVTVAGTPELNATSVVIFIIIGLLSLPVMIVAIAAIVARG